MVSAQCGKKAIAAAYHLSDLEKSYLNIVINKSRIELNEQEPSDTDLLQKLVDDEWLFVMNDGVIIADQKTNYFIKALK